MNAAPAAQTPRQFVEPGFDCVSPEAVVYVGAPIKIATFLLQIGCRDHGTAVRVLEDGRDTRDRRRSRSAREVFSLRLAGVHEVDMRIDHAGHDEKTRCIDRLQAGDARARDFDDAAADDVDIGPGATAARDDGPSLDAELMLHAIPSRAFLRRDGDRRMVHGPLLSKLGSI
jgi:hypothetical protein